MSPVPLSADAEPGAPSGAERRRPSASVRPGRPLGDLAAGLGLLSLVAAATWRLFTLPTSYLVASVGLYLAMAALILRFLPKARSGRGLGAANRVTLLRAGLVLPVAALALQPGMPTSGVAWWVIGLSTVAMILDGVDGLVARRTGISAFGARFDMELDAALLVVLSVLVWRSGKVGAWILFIGAIRYLFVAASWPWPALRADLPPGRWRKTVCVLQGVVLLICLAPSMPSAPANGFAAVALAVLVFSFAVDVRWLLRG